MGSLLAKAGGAALRFLGPVGTALTAIDLAKFGVGLLRGKKGSGKSEITETSPANPMAAFNVKSAGENADTGKGQNSQQQPKIIKEMVH